ncbi:hypothetical protein UB37_00780 [Photobacterium iliopiscarium]|jgi:hypothetical protein|uniref:acyl-homoserine-lactone synthase n=1 Tax=Photobacterium iliopiscarium TaxID=56192 RepID=A0A0D8Q7D0_9GAMM|nr:acyl-homoserine-lactone synthase [Photobacterium iliopiscarium]KJG13471.1 hypothetical protein UB38_09435 [Photobacterium iliopiscarium]KJG26808.1 hypothetical protein UB37_00780 [Photobacterium iliopiscarium]PST96380.1 hypothetical protein C9I87_05120 [Photobacterium iliopiscarium]PSU00084.1 hypothetical protein C9I85_09135 [Photobacterium iliopiscarium]PSV85286.1 hypothetical protein C9J51_03170 [Photobacterium iliopiscarium]
MYTNVIKNSAIPLSSHHQLTLQTNFLRFIDEHIHLNDDNDFFATLVSTRIQTINHLMPLQTDNLYQCITSDYAQEINGIVPLEKLDPYYIEIEKQAIALFGNILYCWAEYESYSIIQRVIKHPLTKNNTAHLIYNDEDITEVVPQIEEDKRLFITPYCDLPITLSNAITLKTIENFVKKKHCYELLYFLAMAINGEYVISYQYDKHTLFPKLLTSAHL